MAIGLEDISKKKRKAVGKKFIPFTTIDNDNDIDDEDVSRGIRPWQSINSGEMTTQTFAAKEAVRRAKRIAARNEQMVAMLETQHDLTVDEDDNPSIRKEKRPGMVDQVKELIEYYFM